MDTQNSISVLLLIVILAITTKQSYAQQTNDEFKLKLKQSLKTDDINLKPELKYQQIEIEKSHKEVLKVSPTTKLPTKFDRIQVLYPPDKYEINLDLSGINLKKNLATNQIDYSTGKYNAVPDARSISQWTQYSGQGAGASVNVGDLDPVRAVNRYKARKRKVKVDRIKKVYGQY